VRFNPVEYLLATSSDDKVVRFWDIDTEECVSQSLPFESTVKNVEFDTQGKCLIASCSSTISAFHWEPFECVGQIELSTLKSRNFSGANSVPSSNGSATNRPNTAFKSLDLRTIDDKILHLGFDESTHRLLLQSTTISVCSSFSLLNVVFCYCCKLFIVATGDQ
jgi:WD40 repeat protein